MLDGCTTMLVIFSTCIFVHCKYNSLKKLGPADIFRGIMVSLYVKGKENGHVQAYAPTGAMVLKWRGSLTSKLDGYPVTSEPHLWRQACPWRKSLSRKIALTRIKFYGRKLQVKAFQTALGQMQECADFMRLWRNFMPRQFSSWTVFIPLVEPQSYSGA